MKNFLLGICVGIILAINLFDSYTSNIAKRGYISIDNKLYYLNEVKSETVNKSNR